jgi:F-type H+-transporting ATPase subunit gamma
MPGVSKELKRRIRSIKSTRKTTRAMEMVSASKLRRAQQSLNAAAPYGRKLSEMLGYIVAAGSAPANPLFETREVGTRLVVLFSADRGLCGGYNNNLFKFVGRTLNEAGEKGIRQLIYPVGRRANDFIRRKFGHLEVAAREPEHQGAVSLEMSKRIAKNAIDLFKAGRVDEVVFIYNQFVSTLIYRPVVDKFLPIDLDALAEMSDEERAFLGRTKYIFEPTAQKVFEALLPKFIESKSYVAFASSITAEHSARMIAMSSATKNCGELIDHLTLVMNKQRQAAITTEINEIVAGAEALTD